MKVQKDVRRLQRHRGASQDRGHPLQRLTLATTGMTGKSSPICSIIEMSTGRRLWGAMKYRHTSTRVSSNSDIGPARSCACSHTRCSQSTSTASKPGLSCKGTQQRADMVTQIFIIGAWTYLLVVHVGHIAVIDEGQDGFCLWALILETWGVLQQKSVTAISNLLARMEISMTSSAPFTPYHVLPACTSSMSY